MIEDGDIYSEDDLRKYRLQVQEHEETLKAKLAHLKTEAMELAKHKQQFQVAKGQLKNFEKKLIFFFSSSRKNGRSKGKRGNCRDRKGAEQTRNGPDGATQRCSRTWKSYA